MRKQLISTVEQVLKEDPRLVLLLGDIGVYGFRNAFKLFPGRVYNIGICEQAMTSMAAGMAKEGLVPILHSIAPFVVERSFEQLKVDVCYQLLPVKVVSVGASYDYAALGCTHHCPGDVAVLRTLPGMQIVVPGSPSEFDRLFRSSYGNRSPTYFRLNERSHHESIDVSFGRAEVLRRGERGTVVVVGPALPAVLDATREMDVTILYYTTVVPFDAATLAANCASGNLAVVEPFYEGTLTADIMAAFPSRPVRLLTLGVPRHFLTSYGSAAEHDESCGLTGPHIRSRLREFFYAKA